MDINVLLCDEKLLEDLCKCDLSFSHFLELNSSTFCKSDFDILLSLLIKKRDNEKNGVFDFQVIFDFNCYAIKFGKAFANYFLDKEVNYDGCFK